MHKTQTEPKKRQNLGWANDNASLFPRLAECRKCGHDVGDTNLDPSQHGLDTLFFCDTCSYEFHVDSSG